jgi:hypothetical protein
MKQNIKFTLIQILPKLIVFSLAVVNFIFVFSHSSPMPNIGGGAVSFCLYCPWYSTWSFTNEPSILLLATFLILINKRWSYLIAIILSGYIAAVGLFHLIFRSMSMFEWWEGVQIYEKNIFLAIEIQWFLAAIVFMLSTFYLIQDILSKNRSHNRFE